MDIVLTGGKASTDTIEAISSKSYVHRLLIAAALSRENVVIKSNIVSNDMEATVGALRALGFDIRMSDKGADGSLFETSPKAVNANTDPCIVDCKESGSTARFILPIASYFAENVTVTGSGKLPKRPMGPLCDVLRRANVSVSSDHLPITLNGKPCAGDYEICGNVSSQFISGLLFLFPLLSDDSTLKITGSFESAAYVDMTIDVLSRFGIKIDRTKDGFFVSKDQKYKSREKIIKAEGDWSNGAYIMALGSLGCGRLFRSLTVRGLDPDSIQGDRAVVKIFEDFKVDIKKEQDSDHGTSYIIKSPPKSCVDVDCSQIPDLVPALAAVAAFAPGNSTFRNISRLRMKESDRIESVQRMLLAIDAEVNITSENGSENMTVFGKGQRNIDHPVTIDSFNDHRIAMASAAIAAASDCPVTIVDAMAVNKSYPGFFEETEKLGLKKTGE